MRGHMKDLGHFLGQPVPDPDLEIRRGGRGWGGTGLPKIFFRSFGPQFELKIREGPPLDPTQTTAMKWLVA